MQKRRESYKRGMQENEKKSHQIKPIFPEGIDIRRKKAGCVFDDKELLRAKGTNIVLIAW